MAQVADMGKLEEAGSVRSPGMENSERVNPSSRDCEGIVSKGKESFDEKVEDGHLHARQENTGLLRAQEGSQRRGSPRRSPLHSRQKRQRSPDGFHGSRHQENGTVEEKVNGRPSWERERGKAKPESGAGHRYRGGSVKAKVRLEDRRTRPRSPASTAAQERCRDAREAPPSSPKRRRHLSPAARTPPPLPLPSRVSSKVHALEVALGELQAPGGAFLRVPARGTQPSVSQRAWLCWQLSHAGAALHWALARLSAVLAAQPWPGGPPGSTPAPAWGEGAQPSEPSRLSQGPAPPPGEKPVCAPQAPCALDPCRRKTP